MGRKEASKRKDNKGRVLQKGENQRADNTYMYRWTDGLGKRQTVYAKTLNELRDKEFDIEKNQRNGLVYSKGNVDVEALIDRYIDYRGNIRPTTKATYAFLQKVLRESPFSRMKLKDIKVATAKDFLKELKAQGYAAATVTSMKKLLHAAFEMACEEEAILRNPFHFKLDWLEKDGQERTALTEEEERLFLDFLKNDKTYGFYYDMVVFLLNTGLRCGEACGVTKADIDLKSRRLTVDRQLRTIDGQLTVTEPKTKAGYRKVGLNTAAGEAVRNILKQRMAQGHENIVDGKTGFLFYTKAGKLMDAETLSGLVRNIVAKYEKNAGAPVPYISAHIFRHTFCTRLINRNLNPKAVQKLMGHSSIEITLRLYAHKSTDEAVEDMLAVM